MKPHCEFLNWQLSSSDEVILDNRVCACRGFISYQPLVVIVCFMIICIYKIISIFITIVMHSNELITKTIFSKFSEERLTIDYMAK